MYPAGRAVGDIVIPEGVEALGLTVFWDCKQLTGVKLELQKQDTVVFYILRDYRIVAHQDQAA